MTLGLKGANSQLIWRESLIVGQPSTPLGRLVEIDEGMPAPAASAMPIAFGDFKAGYLINDRIGVRVLRDPYSNQPYVIFYCTSALAAACSIGAIGELRVAA
jgi:HK97 family phage major capsid protein